MKRHSVCSGLVAVLCAGLLLSAGCQGIFRRPVAVKPAHVRDWVAYLASDAMQGRANGSEQSKEAALWIAEQFEQFGLSPAPGQDSYLQEYSFTRRGTEPVSERNVIAYIEGADPELKGQYIIISAHFDHLGVRKPVGEGGSAIAAVVDAAKKLLTPNKPAEEDFIYNGADDDASGVAAMIGLARIFHRMKARPGRSIVFVAFSGEERGLRGSGHYRANPVFPLDATYLNINFEMVGQCQNIGKRRYYITGPSRSNVDELVGRYNSNGDWQIDPNVKNAERLFLASDNGSFAVIGREQGISYGVPAHTFSFFDGEDHLHRPYDEPDILDYENLASFVNYMAGLVLHLAELQEDVVWTSENHRRMAE